MKRNDILCTNGRKWNMSIASYTMTSICGASNGNNDVAYLLCIFERGKFHRYFCLFLPKYTPSFRMKRSAMKNTTVVLYSLRIVCLINLQIFHDTIPLHVSKGKLRYLCYRIIMLIMISLTKQ